MLSGLKTYLAMLMLLTAAQIVVAGEKVVDFQNALKAYEKDRVPSQTELKQDMAKLKNPPIEINVGEEEHQENEKKEE